VRKTAIPEVPQRKARELRRREVGRLPNPKSCGLLQREAKSGRRPLKRVGGEE